MRPLLFRRGLPGIPGIVATKRAQWQSVRADREKSCLEWPPGEAASSYREMFDLKVRSMFDPKAVGLRWKTRLTTTKPRSEAQRLHRLL
jgi:hypothetical protein